MKYCHTCNTEKHLADFNRKGAKYQSKCRSCQKGYYKNYYDTVPKERARILAKNAIVKAEMREYIRAAKNKPCADCRESYPYYVMQFDHVGSDKQYDIAKLVNYTKFDRVDKEIAKCEVVCANCHATRTWQRRQENL